MMTRSRGETYGSASENAPTPVFLPGKNIGYKTSKSNTGSLRFCAKCFGASHGPGRENVSSTLQRWVLYAVPALCMTFGCGTTHATLNFTAPSAVNTGNPFTVTVDVLYQGKPDTVINSSIHFTSSDPTAVLPTDYYFTPQDAGSHTWTNGFTLVTPGNQTISGSIVGASGINGSASVAVSPQADAQ